MNGFCPFSIYLDDVTMAQAVEYDWNKPVFLHSLLVLCRLPTLDTHWGTLFGHRGWAPHIAVCLPAFLR